MGMNTPNRERSVCNERWTFMVSGKASVLASPNRDQSVSTGKDSRNTTGAPGRGGPRVQLWCLLFFTNTCQGISNGTDGPWTGTGCTKNAGVGHPSRVLPLHCSTVTSYHLHHGHDMASSVWRRCCLPVLRQAAPEGSTIRRSNAQGVCPRREKARQWNLRGGSDGQLCHGVPRTRGVWRIRKIWCHKICETTKCSAKRTGWDSSWDAQVGQRRQVRRHRIDLCHSPHSHGSRRGRPDSIWYEQNEGCKVCSAGKQKATEMQVGQGEVEGKWQHVFASADVWPRGLLSQELWVVLDQPLSRTDVIPRISGKQNNRRWGLCRVHCVPKLVAHAGRRSRNRKLPGWEPETDLSCWSCGVWCLDGFISARLC